MQVGQILALFSLCGAYTMAAMLKMAAIVIPLGWGCLLFKLLLLAYSSGENRGRKGCGGRHAELRDGESCTAIRELHLQGISEGTSLNALRALDFHMYECR